MSGSGKMQVRVFADSSPVLCMNDCVISRRRIWEHVFWVVAGMLGCVWKVAMWVYIAVPVS